MRFKAKYLHILWHNELKFNRQIVELIHNEPQAFDINEHYFITPHKAVFDALSNYSNVILDTSGRKNLINEYGKCADWIFVHALNCGYLPFVFTKNKYLRKTVWRTWGHDVVDYSKRPKRNIFERIIRYFQKELYVYKIRKLHMIGVANNVDIHNIHSVFGNQIKTIKMPYFYKKAEEEKLRELSDEVQCSDETTHILIGHSAHESERHLEALEALSVFKDEDVKIYLPFSYGGTGKYKGTVIDYATKVFGADKVVIKQDFMEYIDFARFIKSMDVVIYNSMDSTGLGTLGLILLFNRGLFLNPNGVLTKGFEADGIKCNYITDIPNMSFENFRNACNDEKLIENYGRVGSVENTRKRCMDLLDMLNKE